MCWKDYILIAAIYTLLLIPLIGALVLVSYDHSNKTIYLNTENTMVLSEPICDIHSGDKLVDIGYLTNSYIIIPNLLEKCIESEVFSLHIEDFIRNNVTIIAPTIERSKRLLEIGKKVLVISNEGGNNIVCTYPIFKILNEARFDAKLYCSNYKEFTP